jgi:putative membrane protein
MIGNVLVSAALSALLLGTAATPREVAAQAIAGPATPALSDSSFLQMAGSLGLLSAKLGRLAAEKSTSPAIRDLAQRMVTDYTIANGEIAAGTRAAAYPAPLMLRQHAQVYERFVRTGKGSFDRKYLAEAMSQQAETERLFRAEAEGGTVMSVKLLASRMLPAVQQRLALARQTAETGGVTATAAVDRGRQGY